MGYVGRHPGRLEAGLQMTPKTEPSPRLRPLYYRTRQGYWRLLDQERFRARLRVWVHGHRAEYDALDEGIRGCISKWLNGSPVTYYGVQRIAAETHFAVAYWSGVKEASEPPPEELEEMEEREPRQARVDRYWVRDGGGQLVMAPEYLDGYLQRVDELLGAQMTGWGRWPRSECWQDRRRRWRRGEASPRKDHVLELCLRTRTRLYWWLTGEGQVWVSSPPDMPDVMPAKPSRAPEEEPAEPPSTTPEPAPYNFFAGCIS